ncbi:LLM class F420-dependent oxidoreductase [Caldilinea sp.]|uniref:LLM class F420-dependent oxidoreductase n=1 Tax=Caldilinea sp. TaxID=2293560 RepID=UPI002D015205|nr:LLM class F420-dependent oxidoreductase [Anaerolineales bacterium]HQY90127.1 LLM class F420-dependent oxidoreductase [Caldilinea sp.]HRA66239.1 LLM class F420-dependent oxidoreductase [Caldilinea sp.]
MQIGVVFPQTEFGNDPAALRDYAQTVEALGYTHVLAYDHVLGANPDRPGGWHGPYTHLTPFHEPFLLFSYMAAVTTRLSFITGILILPQRQTALVAKQAATLDVLTGGRFRLGVGVGWNEVEYEALGEDFHTRGRRSEAQIALLRRLWTEPLLTVHDAWHDISDAGINPLPVQQPIPLWLGGHADVVLERVARLGDGWLPNHRTAQDAAGALAKLDGYLAQQGRTRGDLGIEPRLHYKDGDADYQQRVIADWHAAGANYFSVNTMACGLTTPAQHIHALERFAEAVGV